MTETYSVLMSVYHKEKPEYLREAIESVLNQTVKTDDFVIVCDGPLTNGLDDVIANFVTTFPGLFNIVRLPENVGLARALNKGIVKCKNNIVARMDSDDISAPNRMEEQLKAMKEKDAHIVGSNITEFEGSLDNLGADRIVPETHEEIYEFAKKRTPFNHPSVMYKKDAVIDAGLYEDYRFFEDYNLWATMLYKGYKGYNIQETLLYMRAGQDMYKRRGGFKYVSYIIRFNKHLRKMGFISMKQYLFAITARSIVSIIPNKLRVLIYSKKLRNN